MLKGNGIVFVLGTLTLCFLGACNPKNEPPKGVDLSKHAATINSEDSLEKGSSYLSVYSDVYSYSEQLKHSLTATISLRNLDESNPIYIYRAEYFDTSGKMILNYVPQPIALKPLETINIIIAETDESGGTGANFVFDWAIPKGGIEPLFEAIMISTKGQQGLSFATTGHRIR